MDCANNSEVAIEDDSDGENYERGNGYDERDKHDDDSDGENYESGNDYDERDKGWNCVMCAFVPTPQPEIQRNVNSKRRWLQKHCKH